MSEDPIEAIKQIVECIDEGCVPGNGHVTSGWLRRAPKDEILDWVWGNLRGRVINALERTRDAISTLNPGRAAAMREALVELMQFTCNSCQERFCESDCEEEDGQCVPVPCSAILKARAALAEPARNCDRFNSGDPEKDADDALHAYLDEGVAGFRAVARYLLSPIKEKPCTHATDATI